LVSRDLGAEILTDTLVPHTPGMSVMRLLAENTRVETGYGGGFVGSIDGLRSTFGTVGPQEASDWFYWVDGSLADVGADYTLLQGGSTVWWDFHRWAQAAFIPATLACFPAPFADGGLALYVDEVGAQGQAGATGEVGTQSRAGAALEEWAAASGLQPVLAGGYSEWASVWMDGAEEGTEEATASGASEVAAGSTASATHLLLALPLASISADDTPVLVDSLSPGPAQGVFVTLRDGSLSALTSTGAEGPPLDAAALALRSPRDLSTFTLLLLYRDEGALERLLLELNPDSLRARLALGVDSKRTVCLPAPETTTPK
jgi:hypothetical protein